MLSPSDTAVIFLVALLLFGPEQLPRLARQLGEAMRHMQSATHTFMNEMERAAHSTEAPKPVPAPPAEENFDAMSSGLTGEQSENSEDLGGGESAEPPP